MNKYFEIVTQNGAGKFILNDWTRIDLRLGIPKEALHAFKDPKFEHLGLLPEAEEILKKESKESLLSMIKNARRIEDLEILAKVYPKSQQLLKAAEVKRADFQTEKLS